MGTFEILVPIERIGKDRDLSDWWFLTYMYMYMLPIPDLKLLSF